MNSRNNGALGALSISYYINRVSGDNNQVILILLLGSDRAAVNSFSANPHIRGE